MASASSSSGSLRKYDVFISFRGEDTRTNFTSHLHAAFKRASFEVFRDDKKLEKGNEIAPSLTQAIKDSSVSIIVFSKDYTSSKWCLDELHQIMQYREKAGQFVIPIFYKVEPSDVRNQTGAFKKAFENHKIDQPDKVNRWRAALSEVGKLSGWDCQTSTDESTLIQEIVTDVSTKLECVSKCRGALKDAIGIDEMIKPIEKLLEKSHKVGIWGMGGVGKTTMAKAVFAKLSYRFDNCYFLENVREKTEKNGSEHLCNSLISKLLGQDASRNDAYVARRLGSKRVLVVLDDVDSLMLLEDLQENICNFLAEGSKVIITTRDMQLLRANDYEIHEAKGLSYEKSRRLFISKAFRSDHPEDGFKKLMEGFVRYAQCNPLALKVLGSSVCSVDKKVWDDLLRKLRTGNPDDKIQQVLKLSYYILDHRDQQIFLDIACFFKGESEEFVKELMESYGFYPTVGMQTLKDKALIDTTSGKVEMHDLLQEMGRQIVRQESIKEPGKRSRLWDFSEISNVLGKCEGEKEVEGIMLETNGIRGAVELTAKTFNKMTRLRFLKVYFPLLRIRMIDVKSIPTRLESISTQIRYFHWDCYPMKSLPSNFCAEHLLELNLGHSLVETLWKGVQDLANLRRLKLQWCRKLKELPDFSKACGLESIDLSGCESLRYVRASLLSHQSLISLDIRYCISLESIQSRIHLKSLKQIYLWGCYNLKEFSVSSEELTSLVLTSLDLSETKIEELSPPIGLCLKLRTLYLIKLYLIKCMNLTKLLDNITQLASLEELYFAGCPDLTKLLFKVYRNFPPSLRKLNATKCIYLETVSPSTISSTPQDHCKKLFLFNNCVKLDFGAIEEQVKLLLEKAVHEKEDVEVYYPGKKVPEWFGNNWSRSDSDTLKLCLSSHTLVGFVFCAVAQHFLGFLDIAFRVEEDEMTEVVEFPELTDFSSGNVLLCSYPKLSESILEKIEGKRRNNDATTYNPNLFFKFSFRHGFFPVEKCGVYPIYASGYSELNSNSRKRKAIMISCIDDNKGEALKTEHEGNVPASAAKRLGKSFS